MKRVVVLAALLNIFVSSEVMAAAPSAEIARFCRQQAIEAHPTQRPGAIHGSARAQLDAYRVCVANMQQGPLVLTDQERSIIARNVRPAGGSTLALGAISEGADVPQGVNLMAFPRAVVERVPRMAAYQYFTVENVIAVVRSGTSKVALLIEAR